jgi:predicted DNA-binding transcriptional regulator YafY
MKTDRLVAIIMLLIEKRKVQAGELAEMFGVSTRTIYRDVDAINLAGIPIISYQGAGGGIGIAENYKLDKYLLSQNDISGIIGALTSILGAYRDERLVNALAKMKSLVQPGQDGEMETGGRQVVIDLTPWGGARTTAKIKAIQQATSEGKLLQLRYIDIKGTGTIRVVEPYVLVMKLNRWYLYAWCRMREGFRLFKLDRMEECSVLNERFEKRSIDEETRPWDTAWILGGKPIEMILRVAPTHRTALLEWCGPENMALQEDGYSLARLCYPEDEWIYSFLLGFGAGVEVLSPAHLREIIRKRAEETALLYGRQGGVNEISD